MTPIPYYDKPVIVTFSHADGTPLPPPDKADFAIDASLKPYFAAFLRQLDDKIRFLVRNDPKLIDEEVDECRPNFSILEADSEYLEVAYHEGWYPDGGPFDAETEIPISYLMLPTPEMKHTAGFVERLRAKQKELDDAVKAVKAKEAEIAKKADSYKSLFRQLDLDREKLAKELASLNKDKTKIKEIYDSLSCETYRTFVAWDEEEKDIANMLANKEDS